MRAILTYHSIDRSGSAISVSPETFVEHVSWLSSGAIRVTSVEELMTLPDDIDAAAITFDDAFENFATEAWPHLRARGLGATLFVVTGHIGGLNDWNSGGAVSVPTLPLLGWDRLLQVAAEGVQLGAHTHTHRDLTRLDPSDGVREIEQCVSEIRQRTGVLPRLFAYPFGRVSPAVAALVECRFSYGLTTDLRWLEQADAAARLPRLDMYYFRRSGSLAEWGTAGFRRYVARRAAGRRLKSVLGLA
jgi:peptidoglycan/xylan/chitin deacetylase (PgdA/CDA1 family)